jgi:biotin carboxyl carrier protein
MYNATVNDQQFRISLHDENLIVNDSAIQWDLVRVSEQYFHLLINHKSYRAEIVKTDFINKSFLLKVNGRIYSVELQDKFDVLLEKLGMNKEVAGRTNNIKAPMPGLIVDLRVTEGDRVYPGDPLLILEAMKMENLIKATSESVVKSVKVRKGESVEKNQILIEF